MFEKFEKRKPVQKRIKGKLEQRRKDRRIKRIIALGEAA